MVDLVFPVVIKLVALVLDPSAVVLYFVENIVCVVVVLRLVAVGCVVVTRFADDVLVDDLDVV